MPAGTSAGSPIAATAPGSDFIMNPAKALARKDPDALALAARFPGVRMPLMGLGETDAADLIAYLRDQTSRLSASAQSSAGPK